MEIFEEDYLKHKEDHHKRGLEFLKQKLDFFRYRKDFFRHRRDFFKKRRVIIISLAILVLVFIIILLIALGIKINFLINDELIINLKPLDKYILTQHNKTENITFEFENDNSLLCKSECSYEFVKLANNSIIDNDSLLVDHRGRVRRTYLITTGEFGSGQLLYYFEVRCNNLPSAICKTQGAEKIESSLVSLSYGLSQDERNALSDINHNLNRYLFNLSNLDIEHQELDYNYSIASKILKFTTLFYDDYNEIGYGIEQLDTSIKELIDNSVHLVNLWDLNELKSITELSNENRKLNSFSEVLSETELQLNSLISKHNSLVYNFLSSVNSTDITKNNLSSDYPLKIIYIPPSNSFSSKVVRGVKMQEPICCAFGECKPCCTGSTCQNNISVYPVIFVHGHSFNKDSSPEASLNSFAQIQRKLTKDGIISAGKIDLSNIENVPSGEYGRSGYPISVRASYYYINYFSLGKYVITAKKSERIENYALRLNDIIKIVKDRTGAKKVDIVAHSMGGLVAREYIRIFGEDSVNKLVTIATPNAGISGSSNDLCDFLGSDKECEDMAADSIFLKILNNAPQPKTVKVYTIAALGCDTNNQPGDGIVEQKSAILPYSKNYNITGTCTNAFGNSLHKDILDPDKYPKIYNITRDILNERL